MLSNNIIINNKSEQLKIISEITPPPQNKEKLISVNIYEKEEIDINFKEKTIVSEII